MTTQAGTDLRIESGHHCAVGFWVSGQWGAIDGYEWHHERVHTQRAQALAHLTDRRFAVAQAGEDVGADLAPAEDVDRRAEGIEIAAQRHFGLARHDPLAHFVGDCFQVHAERHYAAVGQALEPAIVVRRLTLGLNR
ncbi:hypothetical protein D3C76_980320 [compost metagenome]